MALVTLDGVTYHFPEAAEPALAGVSASLEEGEFILLTGASGCGKSSLLRAIAGLLPEFYGGTMQGSITYAGQDLRQWDRRALAREIAIVFQDPELQLLTTRVEQEIAFGLENLGLDPLEMRRRVVEALSFFNLLPWRQAPTHELSGGQKQMTVLASMLAMHPRVLLLDEPTSQLDPVVAQDFLGLVHRLNVEFGMTVLLVEQRLDRCFPLVDRVWLMEKGKLVADAAPRHLPQRMARRHFLFLPPVTRLFAGRLPPPWPVSVKEGRDLLSRTGLRAQEAYPGLPVDAPPVGPPRLQLQRVSFAYPQEPRLALKDVNLELYPSSITALLGDTGAGKSTLLKVVAGLVRPQRGSVRLQEHSLLDRSVARIAQDVGYLSQNPNDYLFNDTVWEEIQYSRRMRSLPEDDPWPGQLMDLLSLTPLAGVNPRDLSGGERQRVALAAVLATDPGVLLLDEPTRGLDNLLKQGLGELLSLLSSRGKSILVVTHDVEFAAELAQRVLIMADGEIIADGDREAVLTESLHYAPQLNRLFRGVVPGVVTMAQAEAAWPREDLSLGKEESDA